ncbi:dimethyl sulfoxide reductase anchor subunit family protein [Corynebacterium guangdongense]|uniref:Anaerobic dimethyl sulfoxide reductase subunit C (Anchor subunit) n=1 Tax=Corynebacterium guangdongense TaxID=1783348 RepID=A0ABU1ZY57_9CORY|nr:DmsC/YnfH family molybdoenzyme membrane anchor subunit [Corynebacterium guangdongense]MDR7329846.1 anaerobic dimethyl sulfoxide reductase subunit C (anchor subunit) [Corynebacterium guangdongense]WJZ18409.1 Anaerobic dimethyl sulfoxide reductase chain C [Corynebacterium guangdongense]
MNTHEWPLTLFTVFGQMAVGAFIVLGLIQVLGRRTHSTRVIDRVATPALYAIGPIMVAGFLAAFFHLGNPLHALNALRGWNSSALTQEVLAGVVFAAAGFLFALAQYFRWFSARVRTVLAVLTAVVGVVFIWTMARLYMLPTIPAWDHWTTPAQFYLTALSTGALAIGVAFASWPFLRHAGWLNRLMPAHRDQEDVDENEVLALVATALRWIGVTVVVLLPLELVVLMFFYGRPDSVNPAEYAFPMLWFILRVALLIAGAGLMGLSLVQLAARAEDGSIQQVRAQRTLLVLVTAAYLLVSLSALIGRFIFYGANDRIGI